MQVTALLFPLCILGAYGVVNSVPFDSYPLAWDSRQLLYAAIYYLALLLPFDFTAHGKVRR